MKAIIDGKEINAKVVEDLGFQGGYYTKAVRYKDMEYIIVKKDGIWKERIPQDKLGD